MFTLKYDETLEALVITLLSRNSKCSRLQGKVKITEVEIKKLQLHTAVAASIEQFTQVPVIC